MKDYDYLALFLLFMGFLLFKTGEAANEDADGREINPLSNMEKLKMGTTIFISDFKNSLK